MPAEFTAELPLKRFRAAGFSLLQRGSASDTAGFPCALDQAVIEAASTLRPVRFMLRGKFFIMASFIFREPATGTAGYP